MSLTSLSPEARILDRLNELRATADFICRLDGRLAPTRLSRALRGLHDLSSPDAIRLLELTTKLIELKDALAPIPVSWENPRDIKQMLDNLAVDTEGVQRIISQLFKKES